ncbi:DNA glycosylase AlkZ-like family protein [Saccharopolyspora taberi]|uniref:Crosslink repair DNA glycosylase YcaQ family protein n=1 Tax=Saccharopolyspora taberi TaxID=60895 RepID=A0ABN3VFT0_9PSEU
MLELDRRQVLAYRYRVQQLDRSAAEPDVAELGFQDSPAGTGAQSLLARCPDARADLTLAWTLRGSPHLHRREDLPRLAAELFPLSDADVVARMPVMKQLAEPLRAFGRVVRAMREHAAEPTDKASLSAAVTRDVPEASAWCEPCGSTHVFYSLFLQTGLAAGLELARDGSRVRISALSPWTPPTGATGTASAIRRALRFLGPGGNADVAAFLGTRPTALRGVWPDDLAPVRVEGRQMWARREDLAALESPPEPSGVRLVPVGDPYLQARNRDLTVPDERRRKALWGPAATAGAVLVGGRGRRDLPGEPEGAGVARLGRGVHRHPALSGGGRGRRARRPARRAIRRSGVRALRSPTLVRAFDLPTH